MGREDGIAGGWGCNSTFAGRVSRLRRNCCGRRLGVVRSPLAATAQPRMGRRSIAHGDGPAEPWVRQQRTHQPPKRGGRTWTTPPLSAAPLRGLGRGGGSGPRLAKPRRGLYSRAPCGAEEGSPWRAVMASRMWGLASPCRSGSASNCVIAPGGWQWVDLLSAEGYHAVQSARSPRRSAAGASRAACATSRPSTSTSWIAGCSMITQVRSRNWLRKGTTLEQKAARIQRPRHYRFIRRPVSGSQAGASSGHRNGHARLCDGGWQDCGPHQAPPQWQEDPAKGVRTRGERQAGFRHPSRNVP